MSQWYYAKDGRQNGPVGIEELKSLARSGTLSKTDLVWNPTMKDWLPSAQVDGIFDAVETPAGTPPAISGNPYATPDSAWAPTAVTPLVPGDEIEPGSDPIGVGACIQRGFDLTKKQPLPLILGTLIFFAISIAVTMPFSMAQGIMQATGGPPPMPPREIMEDPVALFQWGVRSQFNVMYFISQAVSLVASAFLMAGFYRICLNVASGVQASPGHLFGESNKLGRVLGLTVLLSLPSWTGILALGFLPIAVGGAVCVVLSFLWIAAFLRLGFAPLAVVDRDLGFADSLKYSLRITKNNTGRIFGLGFLAGLIMMAGFIACLVGGLFTFPVGMMALVVAFRWMQYGRRVIG